MTQLFDPIQLKVALAGAACACAIVVVAWSRLGPGKFRALWALTMAFSVVAALTFPVSTTLREAHAALLYIVAAGWLLSVESCGAILVVPVVVGLLSIFAGALGAPLWLLTLAAGGGAFVLSHRKDFRELDRAPRCSSADPRDADVYFDGVVGGHALTVPMARSDRVVAWCLTLGDRVYYSKSTIWIEDDKGERVDVAPAGFVLVDERGQTIETDDDDARRWIRERLGIEPEKNASVRLDWIEAGDEALIEGRPKWAPRAGEGYRDATERAHFAAKLPDAETMEKLRRELDEPKDDTSPEDESAAPLVEDEAGFIAYHSRLLSKLDAPTWSFDANRAQQLRERRWKAQAWTLWTALCGACAAALIFDWWAP